MTHATNSNMAEVMGWLWDAKLCIWVNGQGKLEAPDLETWGDGWNPTENLNHAALVEARLTELELIEEYMIALAQRAMTFLPKPITENTQIFIGPAYLLATATAQTRCDAAWAAYSAWKEQAT